MSCIVNNSRIPGNNRPAPDRVCHRIENFVVSSGLAPRAHADGDGDDKEKHTFAGVAARGRPKHLSEAPSCADASAADARGPLPSDHEGTWLRGPAPQWCRYHKQSLHFLHYSESSALRAGSVLEVPHLQQLLVAHMLHVLEVEFSWTRDAAAQVTDCWFWLSDCCRFVTPCENNPHYAPRRKNTRWR